MTISHLEPEHDRKIPTDAGSYPDDKPQLLGAQSPGVRRIEEISAHITRLDRVFIFFSVFLVAYVYGLDATIRYTYQVCTPHQECEVQPALTRNSPWQWRLSIAIVYSQRSASSERL